MLIFHAIAALTGLVLIYIGATGRLTTLVTDPDTGRDIASGVGNSLAIGAGFCVVVSAVW